MSQTEGVHLIALSPTWETTGSYEFRGGSFAIADFKSSNS
jgi:hypothetical protein